MRRLLAGYAEPLKLKLVAISAGCPADSPEYASTSFFNLFPPHLLERQVGLFAERLAPVKTFEGIRQRAGVKEAFAARDNIDVHMILIARQCGVCGRTPAEALQPLLNNANLRVFSTLVLDAATARELLKQEEKAEV